MPRIIKAGKWLLPLLLLLCGAPSKATTAPVFGFPAACSPSNGNNGSNSTLTCYLNNVTSGNTVVVFASGVATSLTISSATQALTCPAGLLIFNGTNGIARGCYVVLSSNYSLFTITATVSGSVAAAANISAWQVQGLGTFDAGSATAGSTTSVTTSGTNRILITYCADQGSGANPLPGSGQQQIGWGAQTVVNANGQPVLTETITEAAAGTYTPGCTFDGSVPLTVSAAFPATGVTVPAINIVNSCTFTNGVTAGSGGGCPLNGKQNGTTVIIYALGFTTNTPPASFANNCSSTGPTGATCVFPAGAQAVATFGGAGYVAGIGYSLASGAFTQFIANYTVNPASSNSVTTVAIEVTGITSVDTPSAAAAAALTTNYTTATANEFTACLGVNTSARTNAIAPGSSFIQVMDFWGTGGAGGGIGAIQGQAMAKTTTGSGSNTCSYSVTSSANPLIATLSFGGPVSTLNPRHSQAF